VTTTVTADPARPIGYSSFAELLPGVAVLSIGVRTVTFDADLTPEQVDDVWWFVTSRDDADEARRRNIKALRDAEAQTASPLLLALADAFLGV